MRAGEKIACPRCGERSVVKEKKIFDDDFALKEVKYYCALCGAEVQEKTSDHQKNTAAEQASKRLSELLGGETVAKVRLKPEADDGHFCLHCKNYVKHPFASRCALSMREIEATDSCTEFETP
ncbi:MAG: hypothetical protein IKA87_07010 [Lentisphaeria bacterium]|nr:hypothetical protein [Lentisphaeria bacterium]